MSITLTGAFEHFYADYRVHCGAVTVLQEGGKHPPEVLLQRVWQQQRILREQLRTQEGRQVRILHPGFRSVEGGPDFRGALLQFDEEQAVSGDIEIDLLPAGWRAHGHDTNPAFAKVILRVVWECGNSPTSGPPLLKLAGRLDSPIGELSLVLGADSTAELPEAQRGKCCAPLRTLPPENVRELLHQAARVRLQSKASQLQARAREAGWEQALSEGLFRALGYKHNVWPMQRLGELLPRWNGGGEAPDCIEARLFGIAGLLPREIGRGTSDSDRHIRRIWDQWWRERESLSDCLLPASLWRMHGIRPANHPHRRLALASRWFSACQLGRDLEKWSIASLSDGALAASLLKVFDVGSDKFWSWHHTLKSPRLKQAQPLLGETRATDLAVNVVLPWLWVRAAEGSNEAVKQSVEHRYFAWPAAEDNSVLKLARQRLLGGSGKGVFKGAAAQQGLIQIVRDFCDKTNSLCDHCKLPGLVAAFSEVNRR